jgi:hypothetical protein
MIIAAKSLVINQTGEKLLFYPEKETQDFASFFSFKMEDGNEIIILDGVPSIKVKLDYEAATFSDPIKLNAMGVTEVDLYDGAHKNFNIAIKITNELYGKVREVILISRPG